jgi:hypothetical protein
MKKIILAVALFAVTIAPSYACDICGCSGSGSQYFGILPWYQNHFVGIRYQYKTFTSHHLPLFDGDNAPITHETFTTTELWGRFNLNKKFQLFAFIPFNNYKQTGEGADKHVSGLGDVNLMLAYQLVNTGEERRNWKQLLQVAGGVKLPTGSFTKAEETDPLNINLQPGTGSIDVPVSILYTLRYKKTGISAEGNYRYNNANKDGYIFGDRLGSSVKLFQWANLGKQNSLLPNAGITYEKSFEDFDGVEKNEYSGGHMLSASAGVDAYIKKIVVGVQFQQPLTQHLGSGRIDAHSRISATLSYKL